MKLELFRPLAAAALVAAAALGGTAQARSNVYWSVGIAAAPGVSIGVGNVGVVAPPVYYAPAPVYYAPPVYVAPRRVVLAPPPVYVQAPVYVQYVRPVYRHRWYNGYRY